MSTIKIDKNIPIPPHGTFKAGAKSKTLRKMVKGDSVLIKIEGKTSRHQWRSTAIYIGFRIITRKEGTGFRLWRGEDIK